MSEQESKYPSFKLVIVSSPGCIRFGRFQYILGFNSRIIKSTFVWTICSGLGVEPDSEYKEEVFFNVLIGEILF